MRSSSAQNNLLLPVIVSGIAIIALLWFAAIGPKRADRARAAEDVTTQEARLEKARRQLTEHRAAREQFAGLLVELRSLDVAVPARGDIAGLLREVQKRARLRDSDLRLASLNTAGAATGVAKPVTPGAATGPAGLSALPFTFSYTGKYIDLLRIMRAVRDAVTVQSGNLSIDGRLLTIDGVTFKRPDPRASLTKVVLNATAYIASDPDKPAAAPSAEADPAAGKAAPADTTTKAGT